MTKSPLGTHEKIWNSNLKERLRSRYFKKGYKAAKHGKTKQEDNPYQLSEEIWSLLRKRTMWILGYEAYEWSVEANKKRKKQAAKEIKKYEREQKKKHHVVKEKEKHGKHKRERKHKNG